MRILSSKFFEKKCNFKSNNMNESKLQRVYSYPLYPRDSRNYSDKEFVNLDNGSQGGTHWTCFIIEDNKSFFLTRLVDNQIKIFSINYLNQNNITFLIKHKFSALIYVAHIAYTFSI